MQLNRNTHTQKQACAVTQQTHKHTDFSLGVCVSLWSRMEHGERGMGISHLRYEEEEGECVLTHTHTYTQGSTETSPHTHFITTQLIYESDLRSLGALCACACVQWGGLQSGPVDFLPDHFSVVDAVCQRLCTC